MKKILKLTTVIALILSATGSFANSPETSLIVINEANGDDAGIIKNDESVKPYFRKIDGKIFVNFLNLDKSKVDIKVYDEEYRIVFSETITETMVIEKAFNFEGAYAGNYKVVVSDKKGTYSENFMVD